MRNQELNQELDSPLIKKPTYISHYQKDLIYPIRRADKRKTLGIEAELPFQGKDLWNAFELSWLNLKGKPVIAMAELHIPCDTPNLIESKSLKLYLNSFNNSRFETFQQVENTIIKDLSEATGKEIYFRLFPIGQAKLQCKLNFSGTCLDELDIYCDTYTICKDYLITENQEVSETLFSNLLKSNCMVTGQPDWGSVLISYTGKKIHAEGLLKYIISFRNHDEFGEHCVERMFVDIMARCAPQKLLVYARYTRRGGLDINPYRANYIVDNLENDKLIRQ